MDQFIEYVFLGNSVRDWLICVGIIAGSLLLLRILKLIVLSRIRALASKTESKLDDFAILVIDRSIMPFLYILAFYYGFRYLAMDPRLAQVTQAAIMVVGVFFIIRFITDIIGYSFQRFVEKGSTTDAQLKQARGIILIFKIILWVLGAIFLVDNFGYDITTVITGLGIGGIAIALAAQAVLGDLFSYLVIFFDKPFEIGDFIIVGDKMGTVEYIGIKTTRLRALGGEQLILSNTDLTNSRVQNFKRMERRRVVLTIGVEYETPAEKLRGIPGIVKEIITRQPDVQMDRAHLSGFGDYSINFEIVYFILSSDYNKYMDIQQAINLEIFEAFAAEKIGFAYPTQKLYMEAPALESLAENGKRLAAEHQRQ